jgi:hypothetical protein
MNWLAVFLLLTIAVFVVGVITGAVVPLFGGVRAERIGAIAFAAAAIAETVLGVAEFFDWRLSRNKPGCRTGFPGPKRYGNNKRVG